MHHTLATTLTTGAAIPAFTDVPAVADTVFTTQNNHFIFTDQLMLLSAMGIGATITAFQVFSPSLQPYGNLNVWPLNAAANPGSYPNLADYRDVPFMIPMNEQIQTLATDTAIDTINGFLNIAPPSWSQNKVRGSFHSILACTAAVTTVAGKWSGVQPIAFVNQPIGGWYAVNGIYCLETHANLFRVYFPRSPGLNGRQLRPGSYVTHALGNLEYAGYNNGLGTWGAFHTFEPLQVELFENGAGARTPTLYLDVQYLGQGPAGAYPLNI